MEKSASYFSIRTRPNGGFLETTGLATSRFHENARNSRDDKNLSFFLSTALSFVPALKWMAV